MFHCFFILLFLVRLTEKLRQLCVESVSLVRFNEFTIAFNRASFDEESIFCVFVSLTLEMQVADELRIVIVYALHHPAG